MQRYSLLKNFLFAIVGLWIMQTMSSCGTTKGLILVRGPFDTAKLSKINPVEPVIRKKDILSIIVFSDNPEATKIFNQSVVSASNNSNSAAGGPAATGAGYQVDGDGNIVFQGIGKLKVDGLTKAALKDTLDARL